MNLVIVNQASKRVPKTYLSRLIEFSETQLLRKKAMKPPQAKKDLTLVFLEEAEAKKLNEQFRGKDYATDVLSFDAIEPDSLGELIFCPDVILKQASEHRLSYRDELAYMALHGLLHLLGFDHEQSDQDAQIMFQLQDHIFEAFLQK